jgi:transcriptional regulator with PAS, ATPase and Fis domain
MVKQKRFRQDLYYRINTIDINIPPLRERKDDIAPLSEYFIKKINKDHGCYIEGIADSMVHRFSRYSWPGNVRELEHVLERACVLTISGILDESHFDFFLPRLYRTESQSPLLPSLSDTTAAVEKKAIARVLESVKGNKSKAAGLLHISRTQLYEKLRKYEML